MQIPSLYSSAKNYIVQLSCVHSKKNDENTSLINKNSSTAPEVQETASGYVSFEPLPEGNINDDENRYSLNRHTLLIGGAVAMLAAILVAHLLSAPASVLVSGALIIALLPYGANRLISAISIREAA